MSQETEYGTKDRWSRWREQLKHTYRLVIRDDETFREVTSYRLTMLNAYILISSVFVVVALIVLFLIAFTPLRRYVPGYGSGISGNSQVMALYRQVEDLQDELNAQAKYTEAVRKALTGDVQTEDEVPKVTETPLDTFNEVKISKAEQQLRKEVALEEVGQIAKGTVSSNFVGRDMPLEQMYFIAPISGEVSAGFHLDKGHFGVDILAPNNTPIKAAMDGFVFLSDWVQDTGFTIGIQHGNNVITFYKHNSALLKKVGSFVKAGEAVAIIGNSGEKTNGPHLHFELWYKGKPVNPREYMSF